MCFCPCVPVLVYECDCVRLSVSDLHSPFQFKGQLNGLLHHKFHTHVLEKMGTGPPGAKDGGWPCNNIVLPCSGYFLLQDSGVIWTKSEAQ